MAEQNKKQVTKEEFEKQVEIEMSHLVYMDRLPKAVAFEQARTEVATRFVVA